MRQKKPRNLAEAVGGLAKVRTVDARPRDFFVTWVGREPVGWPGPIRYATGLHVQRREHGVACRAVIVARCAEVVAFRNT